MALEGEGFFTVQTDAGQPRLTRAGEFVLTADGTVRSPQGLTLLRDDGSPFTLPPSGGEIAITTGGEVSRRRDTRRARRASSPWTTRARSCASTAPRSTPRASPARPAEARVRQGFVEGSNVSAVSEMADLIEHVRLFESQQKALQTTDSVLGAVTRDLGAF